MPVFVLAPDVVFLRIVWAMGRLSGRPFSCSRGTSRKLIAMALECADKKGRAATKWEAGFPFAALISMVAVRRL